MQNTCLECGGIIPTGKPSQPRKFCGHQCSERWHKGKERVATADRFWAKVNKNGPTPSHCPELGACWVWTRGKERYGRMKHYGRDVLAHRLSMMFHLGTLSDDDCVLHHCDNTRCVRPAHLFLGTPATNAQDRVAKGREPDRSGERNPRAKLTAEQVETIRARYTRGKRSGPGARGTLAKEFHVSTGAVDRILSRQSWSRITPTPRPC